MPEQPVGIDDAVLSALADMLSTLENVGKRLKALEPAVAEHINRGVATETKVWERLGSADGQINMANENAAVLKLAIDAVRTDQSALMDSHRALEQQYQEVLGVLATTRAEFKQTRGEMEALRTAVGKGIEAGLRAEEQFNKFGRMRDDLDKLILDQNHERSERLEATRRFQRSMRDVSHSIAER
jgi:chromosome segregation ATPase